jgi:cbb3-type cytochrome oxidase maturation protein
MALVSMTGLVFIAWGLRTHQFDDVEGAKYPMLEDKEPVGWPGRERTKGGPKDA